MKKGKFLIPALAMLMCISAGASFASFNASEVNQITVNAEDSEFINLVVGDNTIPVTEDDISSGMILGMFTVETAGYYTFLSDELVVSVGDLEGNILGAGSLELAEGTYFILLGTDTISVAGDYIATIMEGVPAPEPTVHEAGQMYTHESGIGNNTEGEFAFYFRTEANGAAYNDNWSLEYGATSVDNIKLTRNGETTSVAAVGQGMIVRLNETDHYMKFAPWTVSNVLPVQEGDVFTISGTFKATSDETQMFNIAETTVTYKNGALRYSTEPTIHEAGQMYAHENGVNANENGGGANGFAFYFKTEANGAAYNGDWSKEYGATSADNIKLTRNGETTSVATVGQGTIVRINETDHYMKFVPWTTSGLLPLQEGDVLTISGTFKCTSDATQIFEITETTVTYTNGALKYSTDVAVPDEPDEPDKPEEPDYSDAIQAGQLYKHSNEGSANGFYFTTAPNDGVYNEDWSVEYKPVSADNVKITRNGETISVANTEAGTVVKISDRNYYLKFDAWMNGNFPLQDGDVITVSGLFYKDSTYINFTETVVTYMGGVFAFSTDAEVPDEPDVPVVDAIEVGQMFGHTAGGNGNQGVYFTLAENALPFNTDWSVEYKATSETCVKLTRKGETFNVANVGAGLIVKFGATDYYLKAEGWLNEHFPLQDGDVLTVSGTFRARDSETDYFTIAETVITYEFGMYQFSTEEKIEVTQAGYLYAHPYAGGSATGVHFSMAANDSTFNEDWSVEYIPLDEACIKLIRGGQTINVGNPGAGTIVKFRETEYYLKAENWINGNFPLQNGDVIVVDGLFKCNASDDVIAISASYIRVEETVEGYSFKFLNPNVTFVNNDGTVLGVNVYAYEAGVLAEKPEDPTAEVEGYTCTFLGWYNGETAWNFETDTVTTAVVLQAKFEMVAIEYKATFVVDGETMEEITFTVETLDEFELPTIPAKDGYNGKWDKTVDDITLADITFTAVYEEIPVEPEDSSSEVEPEDSSSEVIPEDSSSESKPSTSSPTSNEQSSGCNSTTVGGISVALLGLGAAVALLKKKKED